MEQQTTPAGFYDSQAPHILAIIVVFPSLASLAVFLRLYTRVKIIANPAMDDWCIVVAMLFSIATSVCMGFRALWDGSAHSSVDYVTRLELSQGLVCEYHHIQFRTLIYEALHLVTVPPDCSSKSVMYGCYTMIGLVVLNGIQTFFTGIFTCVPVAFFWDPTIPGGKCVNESALWFSNAGINIVTDFLLLVLPLFILRSLLSPKRQKIGLAVVLALGGFACIASILRLHALYIVTISKDITWDNPGTATWSAIELNLGITCTSITTLKPLLWRFMPSFFGSIYKPNGGTGHPLSQIQARKDSIVLKTATFEAIDEINLRRDVEMCSISGKRSLGSSDDGENLGDNDAYVVEGIDRV